MPGPVDLPAWHALRAHQREIASVHMRDLFAREPQRFARFSLRLPIGASGEPDYRSGDILFDFSKNRVTQETMRLLSTLEVQWPEGTGARVLLGVEGGMVVSGVGVLVRGAYGSRPQEAALSRFSGGVSLTVGGLTVDYAYTPMALLGGGEQHIGMRLRL